MTEAESNGDIAKILGISIRTAEKHAERIFAKVGAESGQAALLHVACLSTGVALRHR